MRDLQRQAYERSLETDRAKAAAQRKLEAEAAEKEAHLRRRHQHHTAALQESRGRWERAAPPREAIRLAFRLPSGKRIQHSFDANVDEEVLMSWSMQWRPLIIDILH